MGRASQGHSLRCAFQNFSGVAELARFRFAADGLDLAEQNESLLELAREALPVNADVGEGPVVFAVGQRHGPGGLALFAQLVQ